ncbi:hypothetical protein B566_EDAN006451 [Ephemera danica]|nr:hypothetical protein B566_EDAN006451 [Ephemera danica]
MNPKFFLCFLLVLIVAVCTMADDPPEKFGEDLTSSESGSNEDDIPYDELLAFYEKLDETMKRLQFLAHNRINDE